jgi:hypothetical protein
MLGELIDLLETLRRAYGEFQDRSFTGQSPMDRKSRRWVNFGCGMLIALILIGAGIWGVFLSWRAKNAKSRLKSTGRVLVFYQ